MDAICVRHVKDLEELQRYNINEEKKLINNGKEANTKELKQYVHDLNNEYKKFKDDLKKELSTKQLSSKEREERLKIGKERFSADIKLKEENKRKELETRLTKELCMMKRKHFNIFHKKEYEFLSTVSYLIYFGLMLFVT